MRNLAQNILIFPVPLPAFAIGCDETEQDLECCND
jgi:hypothetical protein